MLSLLWLIAAMLVSVSCARAATLVDLMVLYTPAAASSQGGDSALESRINLAVAEANYVFQNSLAEVRVRLVHSTRIVYAESGALAADLAWLRQPNGGLEQVHALRAQYAADLVCLVVDEGRDGLRFSGLPGPSAANAFSVIRRADLTGDYYLAVAIGLNFGCQPERADARNQGAFPFSYGYTASTETGEFSSVEASRGRRLPYFSNPDLDFGGGPGHPRFQLGSAEGAPGSANNARTLNFTAPIVAAFQGAAPQTQPPTVFLNAPDSTAALVEGGSVTLSVTADDGEGTVQYVDYFVAAATNPRPKILDPRVEPIAPRLAPVGHSTKPPYSLVWTNLPIGPFHLFAQATDNLGSTAWSRPLFVHVEPANDDFDRRLPVTGFQAEFVADNEFATHEPDEPEHGWNRGHGSLWWTWTAPARGGVEVSAAGSPDRQRFVAVYSGFELASLELLNSARARFEPARVTEDVAAGQTLQIAVDCSNFDDDTNPFGFRLSLRLRPPPANDDFSNRTPLAGNVLQLTNSSVAATAEPGEPDPDGHAPQNTLWWTWTAPGDGLLTLDAPLGHALALYTGSMLGRLVRVASGSRLTVPTTAGATYQITADGAEGDVVLQLLFSTVQIASPADGVRFTVGQSIPITVTATAADGLVERVELFADGARIGGGTEVPFQLLWEAPPPGDHVLSAIALGADGISREAPAVHVAVRPPHDDFADGLGLTGDVFSLNLTNAGASAEVDEPEHSIWEVSGSLWARWTAPARGRVTLDFRGGDVAPVVSVYRGDALSDLTLVSRSYTSWGIEPIAFFDAEPGQTYHLALVNSWNTPAGRIVMAGTFALAPPNDNFADRIVLTGRTAIARGSNTTATAESNEPNPVGRSVWWTWTAPGSGPVRLSTAGSGFPRPFISVYSGSSLSELGLVVSGHDQVAFEALAGVAYEIVVDANGGWVGDIQLLLTSEPPINDDFAQRTPLVGSDVTASALTLAATRESGERDHLGLGGTHSVWWSWTAPSNGQLSADVSRSGFTPILAVYSGGTLDSLSEVGGNRTFLGLVNEVRVDVAHGTTYAIAVDGTEDQLGLVLLDLHFTAAAGNDDFAQRAVLIGTNAVLAGTTLAATHEPGEPTHARLGAGRSVWWTWTAPFNGRATLEWASPQPLVWSVYRGDNVAALTTVLDHGEDGPATFPVIAGAAYAIAVDERADVSDPRPGSFQLGLDLEIAQVEIVSPTNGAVRLGGSFSLEARVADTFAGVERVDFFAGGLGRFASVSNSPYVAVFESELEDLVTLEAVAINADGVTNRSLPVQVLHVPQGLPNDDFAARAPLVGTNILVRGSNTGATAEPGEPNHAGTPPSHSLWWSYVAPARGSVTVTLESNPFNTAMQIYTGNNLTNLTAIIGNWSNGRVNFNVERGHEYLIAMNAFGGIGALAFRVEFAPPPINDDFTNAIVLVGTNLTARGTTAGASKEPGEPNHGGHPGSVRSVWWSWTAPANGLVLVDAAGSDGIVLLWVYTGTSVSNLTSVGPRFTAEAGVTYHIAADSYFQGLNVAINLHAVPPPANDHFTNRLQLAGSSLSVTGYNYFATREAGEPAFADFPGGSSVWWSWTPAVSGSVRLWLTDSHFAIQPQLRLFTGSSVTSLQWVILNISGDDRWFSVVAGTEYQIRLDGYQKEASDFVLHLAGPRLPTPPPNDDFDLRIAVTGSPVTVIGTTLDATLEPGEPNTLGGSVWWSWTATSSGVAHLSTAGSEHITPFAVFIGNTVTSLTEIVRAPFPSPDSAQFPVIAGRTYEIAAVSYLWTENFELHIDVEPGPTYNDAFADRIPLAGESGAATGSNTFATLEPGENPLAGGTGRTLWWAWTAPRTGTAVLDLSGSAFVGGPPPFNVQNSGPLVAIYTGLTLDQLEPIASNSVPMTVQVPPFPGQPARSIVVWRVTDGCRFPAVADTTYQLCVDGANGSLGSIAIRWSMDPLPLGDDGAGEHPAGLAVPPVSPPSNDNFDSRLPLNGSRLRVEGTTVGATAEPGEALHQASRAGASVWYTWTAPASGDVVLSAVGQGGPQAILVYVGSNRTDLFEAVQSSALDLEHDTRFYAVAGVAYQICVSDVAGVERPFTLNLDSTPPPRLNPDAISHVPGGAFRLKLIGTAGQSLVLQTSTNLVTWATVLIDTLQGEDLEVIDRGAAGIDRRFFRIIPLEALLNGGPLRLSRPVAEPGEAFAMRVFGPPGLPFEVEASEDLLRWIRITAGQVIGEWTRAEDWEALDRPQRFYRVRPWR